MSRALDADVVVAGAGPAGASAAAHLGRAGVRVLLVDAQRFPRDKVCGDFVSPVALRELRALGVTRTAGYRRGNVIHDAALFLDGEHLLTSPVPSGGFRSPGRVIPRLRLDAWIAAAAAGAGAELVEERRVVAYQARPRHVEVTIRAPGGQTRALRARVLVGADGSSSVVARAVRGNAADDDRIIAVRGYFRGVEGPPDRADLFFTGDTFPGYAWLFPTGAHQANVGVGAILKTIPPPAEHLRALLLRHVAEDAALRARLGGATLDGRIVGWPLTTYHPRLPVTADRVLLAGDAAGLINPLNGEGIQYALLSGRLAAETVAACMAHGRFGRAELEGYAVAVASSFGHDLALGRLLMQLIRHRALSPLWLEGLRVIVARAAHDPEYAHLAGGVLAGVVPARRFLDFMPVSRTLHQGAAHAALGALRAVTLRPAELLRLAVRGTEAGIAIGSALLSNRDATEEWALGVADGALAEARHPAASA